MKVVEGGDAATLLYFGQSSFQPLIVRGSLLFTDE